MTTHLGSKKPVLFEILPPPTPALNKEAAYRDAAQPIGEFLEWLQEKYGQEEVVRLPPIRDLLAEYFEVDQDECENERRRLLAYQHLLNERHRELESLKALGVEEDD